MNYKLLAIAFVAVVISACGASNDVGSGPPIVEGISFIGMSVSDVDKSIGFYAKATDMKVVHEQTLTNPTSLSELLPRDQATIETRLVKSVNAQLLYMQFDKQSEAGRLAPKVEAYGPGIAHVCYQVNKKTRAYHQLLEAGATPIGEREMVQLNSRRPVEYAYARDLDDIMFEVEHVDVDALELPEPPKNNYRIRHVSLATPDIDRAVAFYSYFLQEKSPRRLGRFFKLSGDKLDKVSGLPETKIEMAWFQVRNLELEIIQYASHPSKTPESPRALDALGYNMIVFDVSDLEEAQAKFTDAGGQIVSRVDAMFGGQIVFGRDPDANLIGLHKAAADSLFSSKNFKDNGI